MDLKLNDEWDLSTGNTDLELLTGADAIAQHLAQRIKMFLGEWFLDTRKGVTYIQQIFVKNPNETVVDSALKTVIIQTPGVAKLTAFELQIDRSLRKLKLSFTAKTNDGEIIEYSEEL